MKKQDLKAYRYIKDADAALVGDFDGSVVYSRLRLGQRAIFWKVAFHWYALPLEQVRRIFRRREHVYGKMCAGGSNYDIESLVLVLADGSELELLVGHNQIGDAVKKDAEKLITALQTAHPEMKYGKE